MLSIIAVIGVTMGSSQTMKAVWTEDLLSLIPPIAFLVGVHYRAKPANPDFPYGYRRAVLIAFLAGALALFGFGAWILFDSTMKLVSAEHPTIGTVRLFGTRVWLGWPMVAALTYSAVPPFLLGRKKVPLARTLHDKALHTDADINKGDWLTGVAGVLGIVGIGFGFWWADGAAAALISFMILKDGAEALGNSVAQLMNARPSAVETKENNPTPDRIQQRLEQLDWVRGARVRLREDGDVLTGEAFVVPRDEHDLVARLQQAAAVASEVDWRVHDVNVVPVRTLE